MIWDGLTYICDIQLDGSKIGFSRCDEAWIEERRINTGQYGDAHRHLRLDDGRAVGTRSEFYVAMILNQLHGNA